MYQLSHLCHYQCSLLLIQSPLVIHQEEEEEEAHQEEVEEEVLGMVQQVLLEIASQMYHLTGLIHPQSQVEALQLEAHQEEVEEVHQEEEAHQGVELHMEEVL
ncbi:hypothetical protein RSOL_168040, partial [Rhizoctonia solani AG-3 Rhs1AP]